MIEQDQRREFQELADKLNELRKQSLQVAEALEAAITRCVEAADRRLGIIADSEEAPTVRKLGYRTSSPSPPEIADHSTQASKRRKCSICHQPGHKAPTCPNGRPKEKTQ